MSVAELVKYMADIQQPYLLKALTTFALCGKTVTGMQADKPGCATMIVTMKKLESLIRAHFEQHEQYQFARFFAFTTHEPVEEGAALLADIRKQHAAITRLFKKLRVMSDQYTAPQHAPATLRLCYAQLFNFEQDVLKHIFIEEDILFPKLLEAGKRKTYHKK